MVKTWRNNLKGYGLRRKCCGQGLLEFLAYEPFYDNRNWSSLVLRRGEAGLERLMPLCSLLKGVMLRRTKEDVGALVSPECLLLGKHVTSLSRNSKELTWRSKASVHHPVQQMMLVT